MAACVDFEWNLFQPKHIFKICPTWKCLQPISHPRFPATIWCTRRGSPFECTKWWFECTKRIRKFGLIFLGFKFVFLVCHSIHDRWNDLERVFAFGWYDGMVCSAWAGRISQRRRCSAKSCTECDLISITVWNVRFVLQVQLPPIEFKCAWMSDFTDLDINCEKHQTTPVTR